MPKFLVNICQGTGPLAYDLKVAIQSGRNIDVTSLVEVIEVVEEYLVFIEGSSTRYEWFRGSDELVYLTRWGNALQSAKEKYPNHYCQLVLVDGTYPVKRMP